MKVTLKDNTINLFKTAAANSIGTRSFVYVTERSGMPNQKWLHNNTDFENDFRRDIFSVNAIVYESFLLIKILWHFFIFGSRDNLRPCGR